MPLTQSLTPRPESPLPRDGAAAVSTMIVMPTTELTRILDYLVDAIDIRELYEPEVAGWDTAQLIRRLERELARAWSATRRLVDTPHAGTEWSQ